MAYTNSSLVSYTKLSPNHSGQRTHSIDRITPHCVVGQLSCESICGCFTSPSRQASCNYGIGTDGRISLCVEEKNRSWCSSSNANDQRAITIECASDKSEPYAMNDKVYASLISLCTDICKRNGKKKLLWFGDKNKALNYAPKSDEMVITVHRWFANKSCPGNWLYARLGDLAAKVTANLGGSTSSTEGTLYRVQVGAYKSKANADAQLAHVNKSSITGNGYRFSSKGRTDIINRNSTGLRLLHGPKSQQSAALLWTYFLGGIQQIDAAKPRYILSDVRRDYAQNHLIYVAFRVMYIH